MTDPPRPARVFSRPEEHYELLHGCIDVLLASGREPARHFSLARANGADIRSIEAHLKTAEAKTIRSPIAQ
jgi:hypothetical protein